MYYFILLSDIDFQIIPCISFEVIRELNLRKKAKKAKKSQIWHKFDLITLEPKKLKFQNVCFLNKKGLVY